MYAKLLTLAGCFGLSLLCLSSSEVQAEENPLLNARQKSIVAIAAFTANGDLAKLKTAFSEGLATGLTVNEIKEILIQLYAYTGFPRSLNGINTFMTVMEERQRNGIRDEPGKEASPMPPGLDRDRYGAETRAKLGGNATIPPPGGYQLFAPAVDSFLKEHLFADIFYRDNFDWQSRELATISALAAMKGTEGQQRFHFNAAMNMGLSEGQMADFLSVIAAQVGQAEADVSKKVLDSVLNGRKK